MSALTFLGLPHIELAAKLTESICTLPAVATVAWCDQAAAKFQTLRPSVLAAVTIGLINDHGELVRVGASGAAGPARDRDRVESLRWRYAAGLPPLGWSLGDPAKWSGPRAERLATLRSYPLWRSSEPGRFWGSLGATELLVGAAPISAIDPRSVVIVECGLPASEVPFEDADPALLRATLGPLANKAALAFGDEFRSGAQALTLREQEVLEHLTLGKSVKEIAAELMRSPHTVHDHVKSLHRKLNASSRGELIARALGHLGICESNVVCKESDLLTT